MNLVELTEEIVKSLVVNADGVSVKEFPSEDEKSILIQVMVDESYYNQVYNYFISTVVNEDEYVDIEDVKINKSMTEDEFYQQFEEFL